MTNILFETVPRVRDRADLPINGLFRLNYFDGRFLTAESLRKEQQHWDLRAQLDAQIFPSGIAWGLGLRFPRDMAYPLPMTGCDPGTFSDKNGVRPDTILTLLPGLAFTGIGRPIAVGAEYGFTLKDLMSGAAATPTVVIDGGTQFAPCVCLAPSQQITGGGGSTMSPGPYLLLIAPTETPEGEAKIYGSVCTSSSQPTLCEADGWRGGFKLSLASFPVTVPLDGICTAWELRGLLSAYYFDVYEHALSQRWQSPFPQADPANRAAPDFCAGLGPFDRQNSPVPLAMVYIGSDQTILFIDPWIPRRPLASTASSAWAANVRGAPTPSACMARLHQFQCQLDESLTTAPFEKRGDAKFVTNRYNLYQRGFRHIPPWGFLPVPPAPTPAANPTGTPATTPGLDRIDVLFAERAAKSYFQGTNVITYTVVAVHDDDIFEDMVRANEKDAIELALCEEDRLETDAAGFVIKSDTAAAHLYKTNVQGALAFAVLAQLYRQLLGHCGGVTLARLANRQVEIVKLVVPIQGLQRLDPITGSVNVASSVAALGAWRRVTELLGAAAPSALRMFVDGLTGPATQPRPFVFYVKQRLVLLDVLYFILDALLEIVSLLGKATRSPAPAVAPGAAAPRPAVKEPNLDYGSVAMLTNSFVPLRQRDRSAPFLDTTTFRQLAQSTQTRLGVYVGALLADETVRPALLGVLQAAAPELWRAGTWTVYTGVKTRLSAQLAEQGVAKDQIAPLARDQAIDLLLRDHPGMGALKIAAIALPDDQATAFETMIQTQTTDVDTSGEKFATLGDEVIYGGRTQPAGQHEQAVFDAAWNAYGGRDISLVAGVDAPAGTTVTRISQVSPATVVELLGSTAAGVAATKVTADAAHLVDASNTLGGSARASDPAFWRAYDAALAHAGGNVSEALGALDHGTTEAAPKDTTTAPHMVAAKEGKASAPKAGTAAPHKVSAQDHKVIAALVTLHSLLGSKGYDDVLVVLRK